MDSPYDPEPDDKARQPDEAEIREMLERSRRDIAEGRTVPLAPVLDRMRATAKQMRSQRTNHAPAGRRPA